MAGLSGCSSASGSDGVFGVVVEAAAGGVFVSLRTAVPGVERNNGRDVGSSARAVARTTAAWAAAINRQWRSSNGRRVIGQRVLARRNEVSAPLRGGSICGVLERGSRGVFRRSEGSGKRS